jgi:hypothetical protein
MTSKRKTVRDGIFTLEGLKQASICGILPYKWAERKGEIYNGKTKYFERNSG